MRLLHLIFASLPLLIDLSHARADTGQFHAAATRITVQDRVPFESLIAYPTAEQEVPFQAGAFTISASRDAPIASGAKFPIILFSHGNGRRGGTSLLHRDLITFLARQGFIVVAPFHPGTNEPLVDRPRQIKKALDAMLADRRFAAHADQSRMGMIGFSFGGAVALEVAGATPDLMNLSNYCHHRTNDPRACVGVPAPSEVNGQVLGRSAYALPLGALVLLEPFGSLFNRDELHTIAIPVLLYRAEQSDLAPEANISAIAAGLPRAPQLRTVPGGHFVFVDPCPTVLVSDSSEICNDAVGVDRKSIHRRVLEEIANFFHGHI